MVSSSSTRRVAALLKKKEVLQLTGMSNGTLYAMVKSGEFCLPIKLGARSIRFVEAEVAAWIEKRMSERDVARGQS